MKAPAKVNLSLHITGKRADGYHLLESVMVPVTLYDEVDIQPGGPLRCVCTGPFASQLSHANNLAENAAKTLAAHAGIPIPAVTITIEKNIPVGAGLGGGSSDAAAVLTLLNRHLGLGYDTPTLRQIGLGLGADVPFFIEAQAAFVSGIGEHISPFPTAPALPLVLVNPGVFLSTASVFTHQPIAFSSPSAPLDIFPSVEDLPHYRNDLEPNAISLQPVIQDVLYSLHQQEGCHLARMSGSGATCFGLFATPELATRAAQNIQLQRWWVMACQRALLAN